MHAQFIKSWTKVFRSQKQLAQRAIDQLSDAQLFEAALPDANSVAVIMRHMAGNMRSRWTDFLNADGEKPDRNRESEFAITPEPRESLMANWEDGWSCVFAAIHALTPEDVERTVLIRNEPHSVPDAVNRQVSHYGYHVGQIMLIARSIVGDDWQWLTIAPGKSDAFNKQMMGDD
jgi:Protein of unknown function (DUF1572)